MRRWRYPWPIHNWSSTGFRTLDSLSKVSLSNASTVLHNRLKFGGALLRFGSVQFACQPSCGTSQAALLALMSHTQRLAWISHSRGQDEGGERGEEREKGRETVEELTGLGGGRGPLPPLL